MLCRIARLDLDYWEYWYYWAIARLKFLRLIWQFFDSTDFFDTDFEIYSQTLDSNIFQIDLWFAFFRTFDWDYWDYLDYWLTKEILTGHNLVLLPAGGKWKIASEEQ